MFISGESKTARLCYNTFIASNGCFMQQNKGLLEGSSVGVLLRMGLRKMYNVFGDTAFQSMSECFCSIWYQGEMTPGLDLGFYTKKTIFTANTVCCEL
jgi:hypothetical protein